MENEEVLFRKKIVELDGICYERDSPVTTEFVQLS